MLIERQPDVQCPDWPPAPYKGLNYYTAADSPLFAQRDGETSLCAEIVGRYETKILLLHGRSGTGKSSFLRAGLLPRLLSGNAGFKCLRSISDITEPYLIRCTNDPIARLRSALIVALTSDPSLALTEKVRSSAAEILRRGNSSTLEDQVVESLELITQNLIGTLVLVFDQSEEVLTLSEDQQSAARKGAFFSMLEELCFRRLDLKIIISLRTEYYGQFCDWFRISPSLTVTTKKVGMEQFMLHGLQNRSDLKAAIERPTIKEGVGRYTAPFLKYGFQYEPGLVDKIAVDIVKHCGESSALPVMQIVCNDLYQSVIRFGQRHEIVLADYNRQGGVEGALDRFVDRSIGAAVRQAYHRPNTSEIGRWRDVLATLVARQEGGALTTLLSPTEKLVETARSKGLRGPIEECLTKMADEKLRLLRKVALVSPDHVNSENFSLGHDAIAASLFRWKEVRERLLEARKRLRRYAVFVTSVCIVLSIGTVLILGQSVLTRKTAIIATNNYAVSEPLLDARIRLLMLLASWSESSGAAKHFLPYEETKSEIVKTLMASPVNMFSAEAFGLSEDGKTIAFTKNNQVHVADVTDLQHPRLIGSVGSSDNPPEPSQLGPWSSVGFLSGLDEPVAYRDGQITMWRGQGNDLTKQVLNLNQLVDLGALKRTPFVEIAGGVIRATVWGQPKLMFQDVHYDAATKRLVAHPIREISDTGQFWPTYSESSSLMAFVKPVQGDSTQSDVVIASRSGDKRSDVRLLNPKPEQFDETIPEGRQPYLRSLAFSTRDETILVRDAPDRFFRFDLKDGNIGNKATLTIPPDAAKLGTVRPAFFSPRPLLAGTQLGDKSRLAWLTLKGIVEIETSEKFEFVQVNEPLLLPSISSLESANKLRYSGDGEMLMLFRQAAPGHVELRVWNTSDRRKSSLSDLSDGALRSEACKIAGFEEGGSKFTPDELKWVRIGRRQPCEGVR
jgi:hypothetical protein